MSKRNPTFARIAGEHGDTNIQGVIAGGAPAPAVLQSVVLFRAGNHVFRCSCALVGHMALLSR